jgi:hypothetical protein
MPSKGGLRLQMLLRWMASLNVFLDKIIQIILLWEVGLVERSTRATALSPDS